jgi:hypothetical protein
MAPNGATRANIQPPPPPVLTVGLPLPTFAGLLVTLLCGGTTAGDPLVLALAVEVGLADGLWLGWVVAIDGATGAALVDGGAGTEETWDTCET